MGTALSALAQFVAPDAARAQGGPPLLTDDPGTPGDGRWEINVAFTVERRRPATLFEAPLLDVNYGLGERIQLKYEVPWLVLHEEGQGARSGLGESLVGVKWRFLDEERHGFSMSIYPQLSFDNPTSSAERGLVEDGLELSLPVQLARSLGPIELGLELGFVLVEGRRDEWLYGLAAEWLWMDGFAVLGEIHGTAAQGFDENDTVFNLGGVVDLHPSASLLFSGGRSLGESGTDLLAYVGVQFRW